LTLNHWTAAQQGLFQLDLLYGDVGDFMSIGRLPISTSSLISTHHDGSHIGQDIDHIGLLSPRSWQSEGGIA
jgi:hypothetical protein